MLKLKLVASVLLISLLCFSVPGFAAEIFEGVMESLEEEEEGFENVILGLGVYYSTEPYTDMDDTVYPVPIVILKYKRFFVDGRSFGFVLKDFDGFSVSLVGKPRFMGYDSDDSSTLEGMEDRDWSLDGGLRLRWKNDYFVMNITGLADLLSEHEGQEVSAVFSKGFFKGALTPRVGVKWQSDSLVDYYYGVGENERRVGRPEYSAGSTVNFIAGITLGVPLGENWAVGVDFEYEGLGSEIEDSPIVDESGTFTTVAGLAYRF